jgi:poly(3-hydroxybutyrate) depolymerase
VSDAFWGIEIIDGPLVYVFLALGAAALVYLLVRPPTVRWALTALIGILAGAVLGAGLVLITDALGSFGPALPLPAAFLVIGTFAALGLAVVNLWRARWWRILTAALSIVAFLITGTIAVNAYYGINRTLGSLFGVSAGAAIDIPTPPPTTTADPTQPLYTTWKPPADMPKKGKVGRLAGADGIPSTISHFAARDAFIYYPPAALVKNPPRLPFMLFMLGQPGTPDPDFIMLSLDKITAQHEGLGPIVVIADQLGAADRDPACTDSTTYGNPATYLNQDVVNWARTNLGVMRSPKYWTVGGYSNGGACAFKFAAQHPDIWGNLVDVSGDEFPGVETQEATIKSAFGGNKAAFEAAKPTSILKANPGAYTKTTAVFTAGESDPGFRPGAERDANAARAAGMNTTYYVVPHAGHLADALAPGIDKGFEVLYPVLGLSAPK